METSLETLSPTRVKLTVEVPFDELKPDIDAAYRSVGKQVRVKGFRPGRVPPPVIDRQVGRGVVLQEAADSALNRSYGEAVRDSELRPLSRPEVEVTGFGDGQPLTFTAELDVRPSFDLPDPASLAVQVPDADVTDDAVAEQLERLREQNAALRDVERAVGEGDFLVLDLLARVDGELVEGGEAAGVSYQQGRGTMVPGLDEAVLGLAAGEQATFDTELVGGVMGGRAAQVTVTVGKVQEQDLPPLDDGLATANGFPDLAALRADVAERLGRARRLDQGVAARDAVLEAFVDAVEVPTPGQMLEAERSARLGQVQRQVAAAGTAWEDWLAAEDKTQESVDAEVDEAARRSVVAQLALDALADAEEIGVTQEELTEQLVRRAQSAGQDPQVYADRLVAEDRVPELLTEVRRGKALAMLMETAAVMDESGREVDLDRLSDDLEPMTAARRAMEQAMAAAQAAEDATVEAGEAEDTTAGDATVEDGTVEDGAGDEEPGSGPADPDGAPVEGDEGAVTDAPAPAAAAGATDEPAA